MELFAPVFELIDLRSFSNLWFWIALAVLWSTTSHYVLGVPYDMIQRARRKGGQVSQDVHALVAINARRADMIGREAGVILVGGLGFLLSALIGLGFGYRVEFAQALSLLIAPGALVWYLRLRLARTILSQQLEGAALFKALMAHRFWMQFIGMIAISVTALWGMYQNLHYYPLTN